MLDAKYEKYYACDCKCDETFDEIDEEEEVFDNIEEAEEDKEE